MRSAALMEPLIETGSILPPVRNLLVFDMNPPQLLSRIKVRHTKSVLSDLSYHSCHINGMCWSSRIVYSVDAAVFEGGLEGTSATRAVMMRSLNRMVIWSPARTSRELLAGTPFSVTAPASHKACARDRRGARRLCLRNTSIRKILILAQTLQGPKLQAPARPRRPPQSGLTAHSAAALRIPSKH